MSTSDRALVLQVQNALRESAMLGHDLAPVGHGHDVSSLFTEPYSAQYKRLVLGTSLNGHPAYKTSSHIALPQGGGVIFDTLRGPKESTSEYLQGTKVKAEALRGIEHSLTHVDPYLHKESSEYADDEDTMFGHMPTGHFGVNPMGIVLSGPHNDPNSKMTAFRVPDYINHAVREPHKGISARDLGEQVSPLTDEEHQEVLRHLKNSSRSASLTTVGAHNPDEGYISTDAEHPLPHGLVVPPNVIHVVHHVRGENHPDPVTQHYAYHPDSERLVNLDPLEQMFGGGH